MTKSSWSFLLAFCVGLGSACAVALEPSRIACAAEQLKATEADADGDGLSDYQETHKYGTDPKKKDTAGKGVSDGEERQRREFTYSVRAIIRVMPPYNLKALNDDYQDVRVRAETKQYAELEVVVYPFNTNAEAIKGNPNWKRDYAGMKEYWTSPRMVSAQKRV